MALILKN